MGPFARVFTGAPGPVKTALPAQIRRWFRSSPIEKMPLRRSWRAFFYGAGVRRPKTAAALLWWAGAVPARAARPCVPAGAGSPGCERRTRLPADRPPLFWSVPRPKMPMSKAARLELLDALRYVMIDVLESSRGRWAAAIVFFAVWGSLALWLLPWGAVLGWIPAAGLAIYLGYVCR